ncbi:dienelactone hydrolase [Rhizobium sp. FKL33]|uniref:alpha/beta hydrolase family protein n=1 Tax=Rhizobium sp. FKL33 TaxID=2562307 RepID=UPI001FEE5A5A|nr:dienelactone hydrolase [Rhizobium sp. FKL33]
MKLLMKTAMIFYSALAALLMPLHCAAAGDFVGVRQITIRSDERGRDLAVTIWHPADAGGTAVTLGESRFFNGTSAILDAPITRGKHPLILLSHGAGLGGTPDAVSWIAAPLAEHGFIVAAPIHPGNGGAYRSAAETMKLWLRPGDISATLTALEKHSLFGKHLETGKIGALGLSMGGSTILALAGARIDPNRLANYCDGDVTNASLCGWVRQSGVDLHEMDMRTADRDNRDKRITFAMAIDPAPVDVFQSTTFSTISIPLVLVNLGSPGTISRTTLASGIAKAMSKSSYSVIEHASHYSMFGVCKPETTAATVIEQIGEPICSDGTGQSRVQIHEQLITLARTAFERELKPD